MDLNKLIKKYKVSLPIGEVDFQAFKRFLTKIKFYRYLIPFIDHLNESDESDPDFVESVELIYQNYQQYNLYDVALMLMFEQMDIRWINSIDETTLRKGLDAIIRCDGTLWSEIIFQRIVKNKMTDRCEIVEFSNFLLLINIQSSWLKMDVSTKLIFANLDQDLPENDQKLFLDWIKNQLVSIFKTNASIVGQEYAMLINRFQESNFITRESFVKRYCDPCVCAYMEKFCDGLLNDFDSQYTQRIKKIVDIDF